MPWVSPLTTVEMELAGVGAGWTDVSTDLTNDPIVMEYGIRNHRPEARVAETGIATFGLRNDAQNSASLLGYYSLMHANKRSGFDYSIRVRIKQVYSGTTRYFLGFLDQIVTMPGVYEELKTMCGIVDYMDETARYHAPTAIQVNKRSDQVFSAVLANLVKQPANSSIATGISVFTYALDNISGDTKAMSVFVELAKSEVGMIFCKRDATAGQTLVFESRHTRAAVSSPALTLDNTMHELQFPGSRADIINSFVMKSFPRVISSGIVLAKIDATIQTAIGPSQSIDLFLDYTDPTQRDTKIGGTAEVDPVATTDYLMNSLSDGTGTNLTSSFTVTIGKFGSRVRFTVTNNGVTAGFVTRLQVRGDGVYSLNPIDAESVDATSIAAYGKNVASIDMLYESNPFTAKSAGDYFKGIWKNPLAHVRVVSFKANQSATILAAALTSDISTRIALVETVSGIVATTVYLINGVRFEIDEFDNMIVSWWLTPANTTQFWQIGVAGASELGTTTILGF